ncbi:cupin domain-containing protein [Macrococcus carouselicus]|uniref:Cupin n=1 Tax=Macrococcus carouselicus TaxID=69969 RepID=A0A9Q8CMD7_9STAP|nr:cupin domain-containing protein [Macrococcus carouselicus]TDM03612.1 cupin [Macrococcus carouselicus]
MRYSLIHAPASPSAPNHMILPVIVYSDVTENPADLFKRNNWHQVWENGVFDYHHFHPNAHEVLGVKSGEAELLIGGENGQTLTVSKGNVLLLPAGYGHKRLSQSADFKIVGAYPAEDKVDTETGYADIKEVNSAINHVALPETDPVEGATGPVFKEWHNIYHCNTAHQ